jgi:hypothetical protein
VLLESTRGGVQVTQEVKARLVRVDDFTAESLEARANSLPPSEKAQAKNWRDVEKKLRASGSCRGKSLIDQACGAYPTGQNCIVNCIKGIRFQPTPTHYGLV